MPLILLIPRLVSTGLQEVGEAAWQGAAVAGAEYDARSVIFSQLCANLVWIDATGGGANENPIVGPFARIRARTGAALEFARFRTGLRLPRRQHDESREQVQRLVVRDTLIRLDPDHDVCFV